MLRRGGAKMLTKYGMDLATAEALIDVAQQAAAAMSVPQNIAVVDESGNLVAFRRMDGAKFFASEIAMAKAFTAAGTRRGTHETYPATQPGQPAFGAQALHGGRFTTIAGGLPLMLADGTVVGGIGVSSGTAAQDLEVAQAAVAAFATLVQG